jgi:hypothetical protein
VTNPAPGGGQSSSVSFTVNNPEPAVASVLPSVLAVGSPDSTVAFSGSGFVAGSIVNLNGTALETQFVSATQVNAVIRAANLASATSLVFAATMSNQEAASALRFR